MDVPGAAEFAEAEARIAGLTDAELVNMHEHPDQWETWAVELGRAELARRALAPEHVAALRAENAAEAKRNADGRKRPPVISYFLSSPLWS